jgi:hypothetical protein
VSSHQALRKLLDAGRENGLPGPHLGNPLRWFRHVIALPVNCALAAALYSAPAPLVTRGSIMIDLYFWPTGNGKKITIMLEETGLQYRILPVNINKGDQFKPEFLAIQS